MKMYKNIKTPQQIYHEQNKNLLRKTNIFFFISSVLASTKKKSHMNISEWEKCYAETIPWSGCEYEYFCNGSLRVWDEP